MYALSSLILSWFCVLIFDLTFSHLVVQSRQLLDFLKGDAFWNVCRFFALICGFGWYELDPELVALDDWVLGQIVEVLFDEFLFFLHWERLLGQVLRIKDCFGWGKFDSGKWVVKIFVKLTKLSEFLLNDPFLDSLLTLQFINGQWFGAILMDSDINHPKLDKLVLSFA